MRIDHRHLHQIGLLFRLNDMRDAKRRLQAHHPVIAVIGCNIAAYPDLAVLAAGNRVERDTGKTLAGILGFAAEQPVASDIDGSAAAAGADHHHAAENEKEFFRQPEFHSSRPGMLGPNHATNTWNLARILAQSP